MGAELQDDELEGLLQEFGAFSTPDRAKRAPRSKRRTLTTPQKQAEAAARRRTQFSEAAEASVPKGFDATEGQAAEATLKLTVCDQRNVRLDFKMRPQTPSGKLFDSFCHLAQLDRWKVH